MKTEGFDIFIETLTNEHRKQFKQEIKETYNIDVKPNQILSLIPTSFDCQLVFVSNREKISIKGKAVQMNASPIRVSFFAPEETKERTLFDERLKKDGHKINLDIVCILLINQVRDNQQVDFKRNIYLNTLSKLNGIKISQTK